jgi:hypothetical protein
MNPLMKPREFLNKLGASLRRGKPSMAARVLARNKELLAEKQALIEETQRRCEHSFEQYDEIKSLRAEVERLQLNDWTTHPEIFHEYRRKVGCLKDENERISGELSAACSRADQLARTNERLLAELGDALNQVAGARIDKQRLRIAEDAVERYHNLETYEEETARAALLQLRVHQMSAKGRTGYGVTVFIPTEVVNKLSSAPQATLAQFRDAVFGAALERAVNGMWNINSRGNCSAILFAPRGANKEIVAGAIFDKDANPQIEFARSRANDSAVRALEQQAIDRQPENKRPEPMPDPITRLVTNGELPRESDSNL